MLAVNHEQPHVDNLENNGTPTHEWFTPSMVDLMELATLRHDYVAGSGMEKAVSGEWVRYEDAVKMIAYTRKRQATMPSALNTIQCPMCTDGRVQHFVSWPTSGEGESRRYLLCNECGWKYGNADLDFEGHVTEVGHDLVNLADEMHGGGESVAEADGRLRNDLYARLMDLAQSLLLDADSEIGVDGLYYEGE